MSTGAAPVSPWQYRAIDYLSRAIEITVTFNNTTRVVSGGTVHRDAGCLFDTIYVGLGADGRPNSSQRTFFVPAGDNTIPKSAFNSLQIDTIEDLFQYQVTAGTGT